MSTFTPMLLDAPLSARSRSARRFGADRRRRRRVGGHLRFRALVPVAAAAARRTLDRHRQRARRASARPVPRRRRSVPRRRQSVWRPGRIHCACACACASRRRPQRVRLAGRALSRFAPRGGARSQSLARPGPRRAAARCPSSRRLRLCSTRRCRPSAKSRASTIRRRCRRRARVEFAALESPAPDKALGPSRSLGPLAYAAPDTTTLATPAAPAKTSIFSIFSPQPTRPAGYDDHTAVYDISARALYMPDGAKIEAHSGLGEYMDDPNHVNEHRARRDAARSLRPAAARIAVPRRGGDPADSGWRRRARSTAARACWPIPS